MKLLALALATGLLASLPQGTTAPATRPATPRAAVDTPHLRVSLSSTPAVIRPGGKVTLTVRIDPKPRMHVYAPGQPDYIPVSLALDRDPALTVAAPTFPTPERVLFAPLNEQQLVYAKPFAITNQLTIGAAPALRKSAKDGALTVAGTLRYQACDDTVCYRPVNVPLQWTLKVAPKP